MSKGCSYFRSDDQTRLWPNGLIPYVVNKRISLVIEAEIKKAIVRFHLETPIRLEPLSMLPGCEDYLEFMHHESESYSSVGRIGGRQAIFLDPSATYATVMHEIMHTLGIGHEHQRPDRKVTIRGVEDDQREVEHNLIGLTEYDPFSIMHYSLRSCIPKPELTKEEVAGIGQTLGFSALDLTSISKLYARPVPCTFGRHAEKYTPQIFFKCEDCWGVKSAFGACYGCYLSCHKDHKGELRQFDQLKEGYASFCDCGKGKHNMDVCLRVITDNEACHQSLFVCSDCFPSVSEEDYAKVAVCVRCKENCHLHHKGDSFFTPAGVCACDTQCKIDKII